MDFSLIPGLLPSATHPYILTLTVSIRLYTSLHLERMPSTLFRLLNFLLIHIFDTPVFTYHFTLSILFPCALTCERISFSLRHSRHM